MRVKWTQEALRDLEGIFDRIKADSTHYAKAVAERIINRCVQIELVPFSGQMVPEYQREDVREAIEYSYRIIYFVGDSTAWILAIVHGAKPLPESPAMIGRPI